MGKGGKAPTKEKVAINLVADKSLEPTRVYANYASVAHSPFDFTISFCDAIPLSPEALKCAKETGEFRIPVVAEIAIPADMVQSLIDALKTQLDKFKKSYREVDRVEQAEEG